MFIYEEPPNLDPLENDDPQDPSLTLALANNITDTNDEILLIKKELQEQEEDMMEGEQKDDILEEETEFVLTKEKKVDIVTKQIMEMLLLDMENGKDNFMCLCLIKQKLLTMEISTRTSRNKQIYLTYTRRERICRSWR